MRVLVPLLVCVLAVPAEGGAARLPARGVLVPGKSLAGVRLGDRPPEVRAVLGTGYRLCGRCGVQTWYYLYGGATRDPVGVGVSFRGGAVSAVFTLGAPLGWRTSSGLRVGDGIDRVRALFGPASWRPCVGYLALSRRTGRVVTSVYADGETVYGFALTRPDEPVCQ